MAGLALAAVALLVTPDELRADSQCPNSDSWLIFFTAQAGSTTASHSCGGFRCFKPISLGPYVQKDDANCDPMTEPCAIELRVPLEFLGNQQNLMETEGAPTPYLYWFNAATPPASCQPWVQAECGQMGVCGVHGLGSQILSDFAETYLELGSVSCSDLSNPLLSTYSVAAWACGFSSACARRQDVTASATPQAVREALGCPPPPPKQRCGTGDERCESCLKRGQASAPPDGEGAGAAPPDAGPHALLRYAAGGAGGSGYPGSTAWNATLGRYWSHDYAQRIVEDQAGDPSQVWLITEYATFREFTGFDAGTGLYATSSPTDEKRKLHYLGAGSGWELAGLDGTVASFDASGRWVEAVDKNGNAKVADYSSGPLTFVTMPDGRREDFGYYPSGLLHTITEVGVDGTTSRTWTYTWAANGLDLVQIDRPDGTAWQFTYGDARYPGYMTLMELLPAPPSSDPPRVEAGWEYDDHKNVVKSWRGAASFTDAAAVDKVSLSFDDPSLPAETTATIDVDATHQDVVTYTIGRDSNSSKPKLVSISGDCPTCGLGPNTQLTYDDPDNPLLPTRQVDGRGVETDFTYDANGEMTSRTEAVGNPTLERTTTWEYGEAAYPAFPTRIQQPSTSGSGFREATLGYDGSGNLASRTIAGAESGGAFSYETVMTYNPAGQMETSDPPGYSSADQTVSTYDSSRGDLVQMTRTDPIVGTTTFGHDPFNRQTSVTAPNHPSDVTTETTYDELNRVTSVTVHGASAGEDLVTTYDYDGYGDLVLTTLPRGNLVENAYDAAGRLVSIERRPDASTHGERTLYTLDTYGHRVREDQQSWNAASQEWETQSFATYEYVTRCQLHETIYADDTATEYDYDCDGNLAAVWDAKHPRASNPPTTSYAYDDLNRITSVTQPWAGAGGGTAATSYGYDVQDHLTAVTDANGNLTSMTYGDRDLMTEQVSIVSGTTTWGYNEHGEQVSQIDARSVTQQRTVDALDRVTLIDYPDDTLDTSYTYDDAAVAWSNGRLTSIGRDDTSVDYAYDRFGRVTEDGALGYVYDKNGNRTEIDYPESVQATSSFDYADRQATLTLQDGAGTPQTIVSASAYDPNGPLAGLTFGNGLSETRDFDQRYLPAEIELGSGGTPLFDWQYTNDAVGNVTAITDAVDSANDRTYGYQDDAYFLASADGPWGSLAWTYDKIGNRLTEEGSGTPTYSYQTNGSGLNTPKLLQAGERQYTYDVAGNEATTKLVDDLAPTNLNYSDEGRLASITVTPDTLFRLSYDGRGLLSESLAPPLNAGGATIESDPTYSSEGVLYHRHHVKEGFTSGNKDRHHFVLYFAGRPVALYRKDVGSSNTVLIYLTTDHLGTPVAESDPSGAKTCDDPNEPFGGSSCGSFLGLPGQWNDESMPDLSYNVYRWYDRNTGRYTRPDPFGKVRRTFEQGWLLARLEPLYAYGRLNPVVFIDPLGLLSDRALCIAKWTAVGAGVGAVTGGVAAGAAAGTACTFVAPGVGTIGCGAGGGAAGAAGGAAAGGAFGAFFGSLLCPDDECKIDRDREPRWTHEHCLRLYEICVSTPGRHKFEQGKRCQDCFGICRREGAWPFALCRLNYYPHGV